MYVYMDVALKFSCMACGKCCRNDWQVTVDEKSYQRNAELFLKAGTQAEFERAFVWNSNMVIIAVRYCSRSNADTLIYIDLGETHSRKIPPPIAGDRANI